MIAGSAGTGVSVSGRRLKALEPPPGPFPLGVPPRSGEREPPPAGGLAPLAPCAFDIRGNRGYLIYNAQVTPPVVVWGSPLGSVERASTVLRSVWNQLDKAERVSAATWRINFAERCLHPLTVERTGRPTRPAFFEAGGTVVEKRAGQLADGTEIPPAIFLDMEVPCRRCEACRRARAHHWRMRALIECARSTRTWFATLTLSPDEQYAALCRAAELASRSNQDFDQLSESERFRLRVRAISPELTRYWKRVRKNSGAPIKFLWVAERHLGGGDAHSAPHFHALVHERDLLKPVRKKVLKDGWRLGFSSFKLIEDEKSVFYLCKYISKEVSCPVRASTRYGSPLRLFPELETKLGTNHRPHALNGGPPAVESFSLEETWSVGLDGAK